MSVPKQKTVTIGETDYVLQHPGMREFMKAKDSFRNQYHNIQSEPYYTWIFKNVVVNPKVGWPEYEENPDEMEELVAAAVLFLERRE